MQLPLLLTKQELSYLQSYEIVNFLGISLILCKSHAICSLQKVGFVSDTDHN